MIQPTLRQTEPQSKLGFDAVLDGRLLAILQDLRSVTNLINEKTNAEAKLQGDVFQHWLSSIQGRLLWLRCAMADTLAECLRLGMLAFLTTTFQLPGVRMVYDSLAVQYREACQKLPTTTSTLRPLELWLLFIGVVTVFDPHEDWLLLAFDRLLATEATWDDARADLEAVMWINYIHDDIGRRAFTALRRNACSAKDW